MAKGPGSLLDRIFDAPKTKRRALEMRKKKKVKHKWHPPKSGPSFDELKTIFSFPKKSISRPWGTLRKTCPECNFESKEVIYICEKCGSDLICLGDS